jgi:hypothetical protein
MKNGIVGYKHCHHCLAGLPPLTSPAEWARLNIGVTKRGFQVWCVRHNVNVMEIDLLGQKIKIRDKREALRTGATTSAKKRRRTRRQNQPGGTRLPVATP